MYKQKGYKLDHGCTQCEDFDSLIDLAIVRIRDKAKVKASDDAIQAWVLSVGPKVILQASLRDIREAAAAF